MLAKSPFAAALESNGMSRQTAHRYQALAAVPEAVFEEALSGPAKATTNGLLARAAMALTTMAHDRSPTPAPNTQAAVR